VSATNLVVDKDEKCDQAQNEMTKVTRNLMVRFPGARIRGWRHKGITQVRATPNGNHVFTRVTPWFLVDRCGVHARVRSSMLHIRFLRLTESSRVFTV